MFTALGLCGSNSHSAIRPNCDHCQEEAFWHGPHGPADACTARGSCGLQGCFSHTLHWSYTADKAGAEEPAWCCTVPAASAAFAAVPKAALALLHLAAMCYLPKCFTFHFSISTARLAPWMLIGVGASACGSSLDCDAGSTQGSWFVNALNQPPTRMLCLD
ncbi:unnamed protein product [Effrenium voratum]|nr:unnamed protein product [Effrenium voratum]